MKKASLLSVFLFVLGFVAKTQTFYNQLQIVPNSIVEPTTIKTPRLMQDTLVFGANIANRGTRKATNVQLSVNVIDQYGISKFKTTQNFGTLLPDSVIQNRPFAQKYTPFQCSVGNWTVGYKVTSDSIDQNPSDDTAMLTLMRTDTILQNYRQDTQVVAFFPKQIFHPNKPLDWGIGMVFKAPTSSTRLNGFDILIPAQKNAQTLFSRTLTLVLFSWQDKNNDGLVQPQERTLVGYSEFAPRANTPNLPTWIKMPILSMTNRNFVNLIKDTTYIGMIHWYGSPTKDSIFFAVDTSFSTEISHNNYKLANQTRYTSVLSAESPTDAVYLTTADTLGNRIFKIQPIMRAWIQYSSDFCFNGTQNSENERVSITLSPNPADIEIDANIDFGEYQRAVVLKIMNTQGKVVLTKNAQNIQKMWWQIPLSNLPIGLYFLQVQTEEGLKTKRFIVVR